jgi:hypothetical protein
MGIDDIQPLPYPWEQQPSETGRAYHAFTIYRDIPLSERTVAAAWLKVQASKGIAETRPPSAPFRGWATKHHWIDRGSAWDKERDRRKREASVAEMIRMAELHARVSQTQINALSRPAVELLQRINANPALLERVETETLFAMMVAASRTIPGMANLERVSRADPEAQRIPTLSGGAPEPRSLLDDIEDAAAAYRLLRESGVVPDGDSTGDADLPGDTSR